jgi:glycosyltransferase involved in cell wall biosynthesis
VSRYLRIARVVREVEMSVKDQVAKAGEPLVTISIPTMNSGQFIGLCLEAISGQNYKNIEVNVIDGGSSDETLDIVRAHGVKEIATFGGALLGARELGARMANGSIVVLLDSDQILEPNAIERAVKMLSDHDMLVLGEDVYSNETFIEKLFHYDRLLIHDVKDFNPYTSVMLPRVYNEKILRDAFSAMSLQALEKVGGQDHAIIYYEAWRISRRVELIPAAVKHVEPDNFRAIWRKFYRWGYTSKDAHLGEYKELIRQKERFRKGMFKPGRFIASLASILLLVMKGVPYAVGLITARVKKS